MTWAFLLVAGPISTAQAAPRVDTARWESFEQQRGPSWRVAWTDDAGRPRALAAPGVDAREIPSIVASVAVLGGADAGELALDGVTRHPQGNTTREIHRYARTWHGAVVEGDEIAVVAIGGHVGSVLVHLTPLPPLPEPAPGELVLPLERGAVLATRHVVPGFIEWRDRSGTVVRRDSTRRENLTVTYEERMPGDPLFTAPARGVTVSAGKLSEVTDDLGTTTLPPPWDVTLDGPEVTILENGTAVAIPDVDDGDLLGGTDLTLEAADFLHHYAVVKDWLQARRPDAVWMDENVTAEVDMVSDVYPCDAWYDVALDALHFAVEHDPTEKDFFYGLYCPPMARVADTVYHEAGHRIHHLILAAGVEALDVSEGSAFYVSTTITGDPIIAPGFFGDPDDYLYRVDEDRVFPDDLTGQTHPDGLIWASFLWNVRTAWEKADGQKGIEAADRLFLGALELGPTLDALWPAVITADDDDGDLSNGTPHFCELTAMMDAQGIGPGTAFSSEPIGPQLSDTDGYDVSANVATDYPECTDNALTAMRVFWTTDPDAPIPDAGTTDDAYALVEMTADGNTWAGRIPRVPAGSHVTYYIEAETSQGVFTTSHEGDVEKLSQFWVGDRKALWCDDLEGDLSGWTTATGWPWNDEQPEVPVLDWEAGAATGAIGEPTTTPSGSVMWATNLDGTYPNQDAEYLLSPALALEQPGVMRILSYQRWAAAEDGIYDRIGIWAPSADGSTWNALWANIATPLAGHPLQDDAWRTREVSLAPVLADDGTHPDLRVGFTLESDNYGAYAGWALDDVCIYELADPDGQYQVRDLEIDDATTLTWSVPWVTPIADVVVRRTTKGVDAVADGNVVAHLAPAEPGATMTWTDDDPPEDATYAVLLASAPEVYWGAIVAGENTASASESPGPRDCACATGRQPSVYWLGVMSMLVLVRRRAKGTA